MGFAPCSALWGLLPFFLEPFIGGKPLYFFIKYPHITTLSLEIPALVGLLILGLPLIVVGQIPPVANDCRRHRLIMRSAFKTHSTGLFNLFLTGFSYQRGVSTPRSLLEHLHYQTELLSYQAMTQC